ncbi:deoxyribodipyrimidine photo-lyase, partial [Eudoraea sp.]|uniref:deoxyribodipyrimidine photo-lyase n=1 Tax=Eudoraea sp. TaxID=1979955 RepID=UPI003C724C20
MEKQPVNIVWLKRDLRLQDHEPLFNSENDKLPYLINYLFEPSIINHPDTSPRHLQFIYHSIKAMEKGLKPYNRRVEVFYGEALAVFQYLKAHFEIKKLYSFRESGIEISWKRDKAIKVFCKKHDIIWKESQRDGILRGIKNRDSWRKQWYSTMSRPVIENNFTVNKYSLNPHPFYLPKNLERQLETYPKVFQPAGESNAWKYLQSFATQRGFNYHRHISKPLESRTA